MQVKTKVITEGSKKTDDWMEKYKLLYINGRGKYLECYFGYASVRIGISAMGSGSLLALL
jgi:hypothetical protein